MTFRLHISKSQFYFLNYINPKIIWIVPFKRYLDWTV